MSPDSMVPAGLRRGESRLRECREGVHDVSQVLVGGEGRFAQRAPKFHSLHFSQSASPSLRTM